VKIALIGDTYPPFRTSGAIQLRDLSMGFARKGHDITMILPDSNISKPWLVEYYHGVKVYRIKSPRSKEINFVSRGIGEFLMPFYLIKNLKKSPINIERFDGIAWYSPSIFFGPLIKYLKKRNNCKSYLIIRDIFPQWTLDIGIMKKGLVYYFFNRVADYQYAIADIIGVQTPGNLKFFENEKKFNKKNIEVLQNWLDLQKNIECTIQIKETPLAGRKIFVYAGNMGIAQSTVMLIELAKAFKENETIGFMFIGRGTELNLLKNIAKKYSLTNTLFYDEIDPDEIPNLYTQCVAGIVSLDEKHKSHNIPGKFLTYMRSGLPVLAVINPGNDLEKIIKKEAVGQICTSHSKENIFESCITLLDQIEKDPKISDRCNKLFQREFNVERAVDQIVNALNN
jgi:glycosyltransferase involved in cell wall biosynthesis